MDRNKNSGNWDWLPQYMPGVAKLMASRRAEVGAEHVALCWRRGVVEQRPGWFFAQEGALAVGTPWDDDPDIAAYINGRITPMQVLLVLRPVGVDAGASSC